jgi:hypothetical protein
MWGACSSLSRQCTGVFSEHTLILQIRQMEKLTKSRAPLLRAEFRTNVQLRVVVSRVANTLMPPPLAPLWFSVNLDARRTQDHMLFLCRCFTRSREHAEQHDM